MQEQQNREQEARNLNPKKNLIGWIGFLVAILAVLLIWVPTLAEFIWLAGLILSIIGVTRKPRKMAIAGIIVSILTVGIAFVAALLDAASFFFMTG